MHRTVRIRTLDPELPLAHKVLGLSSDLACFSIDSFQSVEGERPDAQLIDVVLLSCGKKSTSFPRADRKTRHTGGFYATEGAGSAEAAAGRAME